MCTCSWSVCKRAHAHAHIALHSNTRTRARERERDDEREKSMQKQIGSTIIYVVWLARDLSILKTTVTIALFIRERHPLYCTLNGMQPLNCSEQQQAQNMAALVEDRWDRSSTRYDWTRPRYAFSFCIDHFCVLCLSSHCRNDDFYFLWPISCTILLQHAIATAAIRCCSMANCATLFTSINGKLHINSEYAADCFVPKNGCLVQTDRENIAAQINARRFIMISNASFEKWHDTLR